VSIFSCVEWKHHAKCLTVSCPSASKPIAEPVSSLLCLYQPANGPHPKPSQSSPQSNNLLLQIYFNIILSFTPKLLKSVLHLRSPNKILCICAHSMPFTLSTWPYPSYSSSFHHASNMSLTLTQCLSVCPVSCVQSVSAPTAGSSERGVASPHTPSTPGDSPVPSPPLLQPWTSCVCHRPHWDLTWASSPAGSQVMLLKCINVMT